MAEFFDWQPSERYGELRNDGRSVHHRNELEKEVSAIAAKIAELKTEIERMEWLYDVPLGGNDNQMHGISEHLGGA